MLVTRTLATYLPESSCPPPSPSNSRFFELDQLNGPSEEVWFAAFIAVWMLLWAEHPRVKFVGIFFGCGVLRGIFHINQGWESIGLFLWGALAALAVAITGRWVFLFLLHYLNNALITAVGLYSINAAFTVLFACCIPFAAAIAIEKRAKKPGATAGSRNYDESIES